MDSIKLKNIAHKIFFDFAEKYPEAQNGDYLSSKTNMILAFDSYINKNDVQMLAWAVQENISKKEAKILLKMINDGIEKYLTDNIKIIALN